MGFNIILEEGGKNFSAVKPGDVVVLPAFGATLQEMKYLNDMGCQLVDTTCPWVSKVWNAVDNQAKRSFTSIIHGKYAHEETKATASFAKDYLIVKTMAEANYVRDYILNVRTTPLCPHYLPPLSPPCSPP
jgi:4-hydroxy-3-methylbut-2-enyl diphosphate reductase